MSTETKSRLEQTRQSSLRHAARANRVVVSDPKSGKRIDVSFYAPPEHLAHVVDGLWTTSWDLRDQAPHRTETLSDPTIHIVMERGLSRVVGVHVQRFSRLLEGRGRILAVKLWPGAVAAFTSVSATKFRNRSAPLEEVFPIDARALEESVFAHKEDALAYAPFLACLTEHLGPLPAEARLARTLVEYVANTPLLTQVRDLERSFKNDARTLQRITERYIGVPPKWIIRRVRVQEAAALLAQGPRPLASLAADLGYTDQAHFARDFKAVVGLTPSAFAQRQAAAMAP